MPLYMDIHTVDSDAFSVEDVVKAHMEDLAIQEQFGVTQLKYWVNVEAKTLFCLMKGPTREACHEVHKQSHGNTACNIIEVSDDEFNLFLGKGTHIHDLAQTLSGKIDTGYRTILGISLLDFTTRNHHRVREVYQVIEQHEGVVMSQPQEEIMASFIYASSALKCALSLSHSLATTEQVDYTMALSSGRPVDEKGNTLFEVTKKKTHYLCTVGLKNTIHLDHETQLLAKKENSSLVIPREGVNLIQAEDFVLLFGLFEFVDKNLSAPNVKSTSVYTALGWSKSWVYRKLKSLTGMAPNQFIQEVRLRQALPRLQRGDQTIAEVAFTSGFNSPTYFTKVFHKRFGISPSAFAKNQE